MKFLIFHLLFWTFSITGFAQSLAIDGYAAMVDGHIITAGDVLETTQSARQQLRRRYQGRELAEAQARMFDEGLQRLIENRLILSAFKAVEGKLPEGAVRERADTILRERFNNDRGELLRTLRQVGKSEREWENELREQIIVQQMTGQFVNRRIHITPRMIRERYEEKADEFISPVEMHLRAIALRPVAEDKLPERIAFLASLREELLEGRDFAETASEISQGSHANRGGDQGWVRISTLPEALREALSPLEPGDISEPVITGTQHFLFKVLARRGGEPQPISAVQASLERELRDEEFNRLYAEWIEDLKKKFSVIRFSANQEAIQRRQ
ncbi:MAG: SurA N-terminal domain-containing protein [Verrucomicrobia bacterium]|nr:SurA N-terminal domain-containing protein [Verrucomicrobiota bacterium]MCH8514535.1 SurA N-terminal domain-containing protein [Kiritimatiellia bacterium]